MAAMAKGRAPQREEDTHSQSGSDTANLSNENEKGGCAMGGLRRNEEEPELGEGHFLPPNMVAAPSTCEHAGVRGTGGSYELRCS